MLLVVVISLLVATLASKDGGLSDHVYKKIDVSEGTACYRLFNGTHQFGCHGDESTNTNGVIIVVERSEEFDQVSTCWRQRFTNYDGQFWIVTSITLLNSDSLRKLKASDCIAGIVLIDGDKKMSISDNLPFSDDQSCPNRGSDFYQSSEGACGVEANAKGAIFPEGVRNIDWKLQMVYIKKKEDVESIKKCYNLFNVIPNDPTTSLTYPLCGMTFKLFNSAAGSTEICHRRGQDTAKLLDINLDASFPQVFCGPLMGHNIFGWPTPLSNTQQPSIPPRYMAIVARMDSFGLIPEMSAGEVSVLTSLVAMLAVAKAISSDLEKWEAATNRTSRHVFFAIFNGEAFDYIGSGAAAYRMINGRFPLPPLNLTQLRNINMTDLDVILEPQQIASGSASELYTHVDGERYTKDTNSIDSLVAAMEKGARTFGGRVVKPRKDGKVPAASWHSFAKHDQKVQSIVLAPFEKEYEYSRYNSILDENTWSDEQRKKAIDDVAAAANAMLYAAAEYSGVDVANRTVDTTLVATLFDCLVVAEDWFTCDFLKKINGGRVNKTTGSYAFSAKSTYVSVSNGNPLRLFLHWLMVFSLGSEAHATNVRDKKSCTHLSEHQAMYSYDWQPNPYTGNYSCIRSSIQFGQLQSPAFEIEGYDFKNRTFSTWTESVYTIESVRLFLVQDTSFDTTMMLIGVLVALVSFYGVGKCSESTFIIDEHDARAEEGEPL